MKQTFEGEYDSYMIDDDYVPTIIDCLNANEDIQYDYETTVFGGARYRASIYMDDELIACGVCEIEPGDEHTEEEIYAACVDNIYQGLEDLGWQLD